MLREYYSVGLLLWMIAAQHFPLERLHKGGCLKVKDIRKKSMRQPSNMLGVVLNPLKPPISCQYLPFAQTEDIWLKSALEGKRGFLLITGRNNCDGADDYPVPMGVYFAKQNPPKWMRNRFVPIFKPYYFS
jgi:hypothetical protein